MINIVIKESLEHTSAVVRDVGVVGEGRGGELLLITDKNDSFRLVLERNQIVVLDTLASFINNQVSDFPCLQVL